MKPDTDLAMERWVLVGFLFLAGVATGFAVGALIFASYGGALVSAFTAVAALAYTHWRLREGGWP